jgi:hypothetical protein
MSIITQYLIIAFLRSLKPALCGERRRCRDEIERATTSVGSVAAMQVTQPKTNLRFFVPSFAAFS